MANDGIIIDTCRVLSTCTLLAKKQNNNKDNMRRGTPQETLLSTINTTIALTDVLPRGPETLDKGGNTIKLINIMWPPPNAFLLESLSGLNQ